MLYSTTYELARDQLLSLKLILREQNFDFKDALRDMTDESCKKPKMKFHIILYTSFLRSLVFKLPRDLPATFFIYLVLFSIVCRNTWCSNSGQW